MKCPIETHENPELLLAYCAGKLDPKTQTILDQHFGACPHCREFQKSQATVWQALDGWEAMPVSADFDRRLYRRMEEEHAQASWWARLVRPFRPVFQTPLTSRGLPVAAAAVLILLAGVILERANKLAAPEDMAERIESIQPDQVERTLDDMEMLREFRLNSSGDAGNVNSM